MVSQYGIANMLSLAYVKNKHEVIYDISNGNQFMVHEPDVSTYILCQSRHGIYYLNIGKESVALVNTAEDKESKYTVNDNKRAALAREMQETIESSTKDFINIIEANLLQNRTVTKQEILIAADIFGPQG